MRGLLTGVLIIAVGVLTSASAVAQPEMPGPLTVVEWDAGRVEAADVELPTRVYFPSEDAGPHPVVAVVHGASRNGSYMRVMAETVASRGVVAVVPDIPCNFLGCDHDDNAAQISALLDWAVEESATAGSHIAGLVDGERRGVVGHSWGGLASHLAAARDDRIDALVLLDPNDDLGVGADETGSIVASTLQLFAENIGACNSMWDEDIITPALYGARAQLTISGSGHCDPEDPTDTLCPIACGFGDRETTPIFRRYAVTWLACILNSDESVAPWAGGASFDDDVAAGLLQDVVTVGLEDLSCRAIGPTDADADADVDADIDADVDSDADSDGDVDADADAVDDGGGAFDAGTDVGPRPDAGGEGESGEDGCDCAVTGVRQRTVTGFVLVLAALLVFRRGARRL